jgi:hypothetical protein
MNEQYLTDLLARRNADGGWGAIAGAPSDSECTALALLALDRTGTGDAEIAAAEEWLLARQGPEGAWHYRDDGPRTLWPTPIVTLALNRRGHSAEVERAMIWLLARKGAQLPWLGRLREFLSGRQVVELDTTLDGWPWAEGTFAWVEPTAWAVMAIKAVWPNRAPRPAEKRASEGEAMIIDRSCPEGGWNYGNRRVLNVDLEPYPDTTAIALLALRGRRASEVEAGFAALDRLLGNNASGLALALAALSYRAWERDAQHLQGRLNARYQDGGFLGETRTLALATLATDQAPGWLGMRG